METRRRVVLLLIVTGLVALPAAILSAACVGRSCDDESERTDDVPFCSLPADLRELITAGFYEGRSPDVLGVSGGRGSLVSTVEVGLRVPWPRDEDRAAEVPLVLIGPGIAGDALPSGVTLDQVAPTLEGALGIERSFPEVRSGEAIRGTGLGSGSPLAVVIVVKGASEVPVTPAVPALTGTARVPSLPLDPAAVLTTIGTGGLPSQHGITGTWIRGDDGPVKAFSSGAPGTVIAAFGDDLDELTSGEADVALVATRTQDRGLIGGTWYGGEDDDTVIVRPGDPAQEVRQLLAAGWGADEVPDLLGVVLEGTPDATNEIVADVRRVVPDAVIAITATGDLAPTRPVTLASEVLAGVPAFGGDAPGGIFVDRDEATAAGITSQATVDAMRALEANGGPLFADVFAGFAVRFGEYC